MGRKCRCPSHNAGARGASSAAGIPILPTCTCYLQYTGANMAVAKEAAALGAPGASNRTLFLDHYFPEVRAAACTCAKGCITGPVRVVQPGCARFSSLWPHTPVPDPSCAKDPAAPSVSGRVLCRVLACGIFSEQTCLVPSPGLVRH